MYRIGIDIGGTFTDLVVGDQRTGQTYAFKSLTSEDPVTCLGNGLNKAALELGISLQELLGNVVDGFCFGSTIGVNTLLTFTGSRVGIITTRGHRDSYHMFQKERLGVVDLRDAIEQVFKPLVSHRHIIEVDERIDCFGNVVVPLHEKGVEDAVRHLVERHEVDAIVISFLWSHRNSDHEQRARAIVSQLHPEVFVSVGSELVREAGEFRRTATAVINAYIGKRVIEQGRRVADFLTANGLRAPILVMQSLGGVAPLREVIKRPAYLLLGQRMSLAWTWGALASM
jgi:N-methylhydantoinase A